MGKKSKKGAARAKAAAASAGSAAAAPAPAASVGSAAGTSNAAGVELTTSSNGGVLARSGNGGKTKMKCVRCYATLKDFAKARPCPGCAELYCWRCAKKKFRECLNGKNCVEPLSRCAECWSGGTMIKVGAAILDENQLEVPADGDVYIPIAARRQIEELVSNDELLSMAAMPFRRCPSGLKCRWDTAVVDEEGYYWSCPSECHACASVADASRPSFFRKCSQCIGVHCTACDDALKVHLQTPVPVVKSPDLLKKLRSEFANAMFRCRECNQNVCGNCASNALTDMTPFARDASGGFDTLCSPCTEKKYWSAKPCTNPTCPNEVGVPTKRCGDCHIARYCSVECQEMAYPAHRNRCQAILARRVAAGK